MAYQSDQYTQSAGKWYFPLLSQSTGRQVISDKGHLSRYGKCQAGGLFGVKVLIKFRLQAGCSATEFGIKMRSHPSELIGSICCRTASRYEKPALTPLRNSSVTVTVVNATPRYRVPSRSSLPADAKLDNAVVSKIKSRIGRILKQLVNRTWSHVDLGSALLEDIFHFFLRET